MRKGTLLYCTYLSLELISPDYQPQLAQVPKETSAASALVAQPCRAHASLGAHTRTNQSL